MPGALVLKGQRARFEVGGGDFRLIADFRSGIRSHSGQNWRASGLVHVGVVTAEWYDMFGPAKLVDLRS